MKLAEFSRPTVPVGYGRLILDVVALHDVPADDLLAAAGVPGELLEAPGGRLTAWQAGALLLQAMELCDEPAIGYEIGLHSSLTSHGIMGYGLLSSSTVRDAIGLGEKFLPLLLPMVSIRHFVDGRTGVIEVAETAPVGPVRQCLLDLFLVGLSRMAPILTNGAGDPGQVELWFEGPAPDYYQRFRDRLPTMRFDMGANQMRFPASDLDVELEMANHVTASMVEEQCRAELEQLGLDADLLTQVRAALRSNGSGFPDLETVAGRLHMAGRTLKRRLAEHGTGFREQVEAARRAEAIRLLQTTSLSVAQVARRLGYADASSFSRAFQKWTSASPGSYRHRRQEIS
jgi:AraC-like DNA-binding protein